MRARLSWRRGVCARVGVLENVPGSAGEALYDDAGATVDDLREAVATLEEIEPTARRVLGGAHPLAQRIEGSLRDARAALVAAEQLHNT